MTIDIQNLPHIRSMSQIAQPAAHSNAIKRSLPHLANLAKTIVRAAEGEKLADAKHRRFMADSLDRIR